MEPVDIVRCHSDGYKCYTANGDRSAWPNLITQTLWKKRDLQHRKEGLQLPFLVWRWRRPQEKDPQVALWSQQGIRYLSRTNTRTCQQPEAAWKQILSQDFWRKAQRGLNFGLGKPSADDPVEPARALDLKNSEVLKGCFNTVFSCYVCGHFLGTIKNEYTFWYLEVGTAITNT